MGHSLDPQIDVAVITGGTAGLGKEIATQLAARGVKCAVLDIRTPSEHEMVPSVAYFQCDVSDPHQVAAAHVQIAESVGQATILINNAGVANGKPLLDLSVLEINKTIGVNLMLSFYTTKEFLPLMIQAHRGYVVTVGSVLGYMSPARLSAYGALKAGMIAFHESLSYEVGPPHSAPLGVKTLLICPGQMRTELFRGVSTPSLLLAPELEPKYVAQKLVSALELGRRGEIRLPFYGNFLPVFRAVPWPVTEAARYFSGIDNSMRTFKESVKKASREATAITASVVSLRSSIP